ncbi:prolyl oligopeptidase family serine peptidase [Flavobacterium sp.]|uniref:S9 family peptidase n=1 Tax=Flavobacterium sp. TaxID=239 RepID=UPI002634EC1C|nr:prolyl oligopeptidase family serine peptidase [Flavobacterium sp.]
MMAFIFRMVCLLSLLLHACPVLGQAAIKDLTPADYHLWSKLSDIALSGDGKWASYGVYYESGADTLFVKGTDGKITYDFPKGINGRFFGHDQFACLRTGLGLCIANLKTGKIQIFEKVVRYELTNGNCIVTETTDDGNGKNLTIYTADGAKRFTIENAGAWSYNAKADALIYQDSMAGNHRLFLYRFSKFGLVHIPDVGTEAVTDFSWQDNGQSVAFLKQNSDNAIIGLFNLLTGKYQEMKPIDCAGVKQDKIFMSTTFTPLKISPDRTKVFFGIGNKAIAAPENGVEIWNAADKVIYPEKAALAGFENKSKIGCWTPAANGCVLITNNTLPDCTISSDGKYALLWKPYAYQPQQKQFGDVDYYLLDIEDGTKKLLLEKQSGNQSLTFFSPGGKFVTYYRDKRWWAYEIISRKTIDLTGNVPTVFEDQQYDWAGDVPPYGYAGWTKDDKAILVYDQFDLWQINTDGGALRLTAGRDKNIVYRIIGLNESQSGGINFSGIRVGVFDLSKGLWLAARDHARTGFCKWVPHNKTALTISGENSLSALCVSGNGACALYVEQNFNVPPKLMFKSGHTVPKLLFQSNPQHFKYKWDGFEIVSYRNSKGSALQGILFYPAGYDVTKSYPVIVRIYEKQFWNWYEYINPTMYNQSGYNRANFISQGYFVFEPDINYEIGNPGLSAVDCVSAAVKSILNVPGVDKNKIGLIGNSFGGYETNMIIGKTDLFAAAVSGASVCDLTPHFYCVNDNSSRPNNYHLESGQFRMVRPIYEDREGYAANSPINFVENINTPVLLWTGKDDPQVSPKQTMEFHMALRRLGKPNVMLAYPNESHSMFGLKSRIDLTSRVAQWFGYYLKGEPIADWMQPDQF